MEFLTLLLIEMLRKCNDDDDLNGKCMNFPCVVSIKRERLFFSFLRERSFFCVKVICGNLCVFHEK